MPRAIREVEAFDCLESIDAGHHRDVADVLDAALFHDAHRSELSELIQSKFNMVWASRFYWTDHKDQDENALKVYEEGSQDSGFTAERFAESPSKDRIRQAILEDWSDA